MCIRPRCDNVHNFRMRSFGDLIVTDEGTYCTAECASKDGYTASQINKSFVYVGGCFCQDASHTCYACGGVNESVTCARCDSTTSLTICDFNHIYCEECQSSHHCFHDGETSFREIHLCECAADQPDSVENYRFSLVNSRVRTMKVKIKPLETNPELEFLVDEHHLNHHLVKIIDDFVGVFRTTHGRAAAELERAVKRNRAQPLSTRADVMSGPLFDSPGTVSVVVGRELIERIDGAVLTLADIWGYYGRFPTGDWGWVKGNGFNGEMSSFIQIQII